MKAFLTLAMVATMAGTAAAQTAGAPASPTARAAFMDQSGKGMGTASFSQVPNGVLIDIDLKGLPPGEHGIHLHTTGKCEGEGKFASAGGHFAPGGHEHGYMSSKGPHAGDLPNLVVPENGNLKQQVFTSGVTLGAGETSVFDADGTAIVIHAKADDYRSQPAGDSGDRIACGVLVK